jgi:uncharacterized protein YndB with AHSA1/START domain
MAATETLPDTTLRIARTINAPVERVYRAWTTPEELKQWHAPFDYVVTDVAVDLRVGGRFRLTMQQPGTDVVNVAAGVYSEIIPNKKLVLTWRWENSKNNPGESQLTLEFNARGTKTEVVLTHERLLDAKSRDDHGKGWNGCIDKLAAFMLT